MSVRDSRILIQVDDRGAIYPVTIDPFVKKATLSAAGGATGDSAGVSVGISGDTIVVGADKVVTGPGATGSAYVFVKPAGGWATSTAPAKLTASDKAADDAFGSSVAISGSTIVVAAVTDDIGPAADRGSAYVFTKPAGGWATGTQTAKLTASDGAAGDKFGSSVAVDGDTVVVGAYYDATGSTTAHGSGYVFVKPAGAWVNTTQTAKLTASDEATNWQVGRSAGISGNTIALGAHGATVGSTIHAGALYVYVKPVGGWANATEVARLTSATPLENAFNGWSIGISGDTVVGGEINIASVASTVHVYVKPSGGWVDATETAKLSASDGHASDYVGISVAISGATIVAGSSIGAAAYVFVKPAGGWVDANETQKLTVTPAADGFGASVGIVGDAIVVGAPGADIATATSNEGGAFVFERPSATTRKPDGRIRLGTSGAYIGDNIYNATGASQSKTGSAKANRTITFQLSIQNDGAGSSDAFKLKATGAATSKFTVKYLKGSTDITAAVVAGTYTTAALAPGATVTITAKVTVKASSAVGNSVTRLVTITSVGDGTKKDAVKLVGKRS
jgi:hypothetical protein